MLLQDQVETYRYSNAELLQALNMGILTARRLRPDLFIGVAAADLPEYDTVDSTAVDIDVQYRTAFVLAHKLREGVTGLLTAQAVQIHLALNAPVSAAQLAGDIGPDAWTSETQLVVDIEQGGDVEFIAQAGFEDSLIVTLLLECPGRGGR